MAIILVQQPDDVRVWACDPASRTRWWVRTMPLRDALREAGAPFLDGKADHQVERRAALLAVCAELP